MAPSMLVIPTVWQPSATPSSPISPQRQHHFSAGPTAPNNNQAILAILSAYDDVIFDFSQPGTLGMSWYNLMAANVTDRVYKIAISGNNNNPNNSSSQPTAQDSTGVPRMELNADIDGVYDWCADQAWWSADNEHQQQQLPSACSAGPMSPSGGGGGFTSMSFDPAALAAVAAARQANREQKIFRFENGHYASDRLRRDLKIVSKPTTTAK